MASGAAMDRDSEMTILQLQIDVAREVLEALEPSDESSKAEDNSDFVTPIKLQIAELERSLACLRDRRIAQSMANAVNTGSGVVRRTVGDEYQAFQDRAVALRLSGRRAPEIHPWVPPEANHENNEMISRFEDLNISNDNGGSFVPYANAEIDAYASASQHVEPVERGVKCIACSDIKPISQIFEASCSHTYCAECLSGLYEDAIVDETLHPPRCCRRAFPHDEVKPFIGDELAEKYEAKAIENRVYCHDPVCSTFIPPNSESTSFFAYVKGDDTLSKGKSKKYAGNVTCPSCEKSTCAECKCRGHTGTCGKKQDEELIKLTKDAGFQRCECGHMVELTVGCYHMTCRCRRQFCYLCAKRWKTCRCIHWDEGRLQMRAEQIADRNDAALAGAARGERVAAIARDLRERHECDHRGWFEKLEGRYECEMCNDQLAEFILQCPGCHTLMCLRCKHNRL